MKRLFAFFTSLALLVAVDAGAKITFPSVISDNMVLQQQTEAALWGKAVPGKTVTVKAGWAKSPIKTVADSETGKWSGRISTPAAGGMPADWLKTIPMDPESIRFDLDMFLPNPDDVDIAPDNIWRDNIFTYIDLGPKALTMTQRPIVNLLVQGSEVPVGYRTRGPNSRLIVVEAVGDLVLRNGKKLICVKLMNLKEKFLK